MKLTKQLLKEMVLKEMNIVSEGDGLYFGKDSWIVGLRKFLSLNTLKGDVCALKLALFLLFLQPGAPCIYYGTEVGLSGGSEPDCRESFPWESFCGTDLRSFVFALVSLVNQIYVLEVLSNVL